MARYDPALERVPARVAQALFAGEEMVTTANLAIVTAIEAAASNTRLAWRKDWAVFRAWAPGPGGAVVSGGRGPGPPAGTAVAVRPGHAGRGGGEPPRAITTVRRYLITLSTLHRLLDVPGPTKAAIVRNTLKARARRSSGQGQAAALRWAEVEARCEVLPDDQALLRDKTLLAVAHNTLPRRAEKS